MPDPSRPSVPAPPRAAGPADRHARLAAAVALVWLGAAPLPANGPQPGRGSLSHRRPGPTLELVREAGSALDVRGLEPGGSELLSVRLDRGDGRAGPVALAVTGLPPGFVTGHPATLGPGGTATLSLAVEPWVPDGSYPFEVTATAAGHAVSVAGTLVVGDLPNLVSLTPDTIRSGRTTVVTLRGRDLEAVDVVAAAPFPDARSRVLPRVSVLSANARGTRVTVRVDASAPGVEGYYELVAFDATGRASAPLRVVADRSSAPWPGWEPAAPPP